MARIARMDKPVSVHMYLPKHLVDAINILHLDPTTLKPRYGSLSSYIERLVREDFQRRGIQIQEAQTGGAK